MNYINNIGLFNKDDSVNVVIEICPGTSNKDELVDKTFDKIVTVRQVIGKYPFYYGSFPQTLADDNDPLDFILFTDKQHKQLDIVRVDVIGAIHTIDDGDVDDKLICVEQGCNLKSAKKDLKHALKFLHSYKGKNSNMQIDDKLVSMEDAQKLLVESNKSFRLNKAEHLVSQSNSTRNVFRRNV